MWLCMNSKILAKNRRQNDCSSRDAQVRRSRKPQHLPAPPWDHRVPAQQETPFPTAGAWEQMGNGFQEKGPTFSSPAGRCSSYGLQQHLGSMPCPGAVATAHCQPEKTSLAAEELLLSSQGESPDTHWQLTHRQSKLTLGHTMEMCCGAKGFQWHPAGPPAAGRTPWEKRKQILLRKPRNGKTSLRRCKAFYELCFWEDSGG